MTRTVGMTPRAEAVLARLQQHRAKADASAKPQASAKAPSSPRAMLARLEAYRARTDAASGKTKASTNPLPVIAGINAAKSQAVSSATGAERRTRKPLPDIAGSNLVKSQTKSYTAGAERRPCSPDLFLEIASESASTDREVTIVKRVSSRKTTAGPRTGNNIEVRLAQRKADRLAQEAAAKKSAAAKPIRLTDNELATQQALKDERRLEDLALQKIRRSNALHFNAKVAPIVASGSPESRVKRRPATSGPVNRDPTKILPSRGWEYTPQIQGPPKREARQAASSTGSSKVSSSRSLPSVSLPPRPSAPTPMVRTATPTSSSSKHSFRSAKSDNNMDSHSELSFNSASNGTSYSGRPESTLYYTAEERSTVSGKGKQARTSSSTSSCYSAENMSAISIPRSQARTVSSTSTVYSAEDMSAVTIPKVQARIVSSTSTAYSAEEMSVVSIPRTQARITSSTSSTYTAENMSAISTPRTQARSISSSSSVESRDERKSAVSSHRTTSSSTVRPALRQKQLLPKPKVQKSVKFMTTNGLRIREVDNWIVPAIHVHNADLVDACGPLIRWEDDNYLMGKWEQSHLTHGCKMEELQFSPERNLPLRW